MTRTVKWSAATAALVVLLLVAAWFLLLSPKRSAAAELRDQTVAQEDGNARLQRQIADVKKKAQDLPAQRARLAVIAQQLPPVPDLPTFVRLLDGEAKASGVSIWDLNPSAPSSREPNPAAPAGPVTPGAGKAATGAPYLQEIPFELKVKGDYVEVQDFLTRIEDLPRPLVVTSVIVEPNSKDTPNDPVDRNGKLVAVKSVELTIKGSIFIATPHPPAAAPGQAVAPQAPGTPAK